MGRKRVPVIFPSIVRWVWIGNGVYSMTYLHLHLVQAKSCHVWCLSFTANSSNPHTPRKVSNYMKSDNISNITYMCQLQKLSLNGNQNIITYGLCSVCSLFLYLLSLEVPYSDPFCCFLWNLWGAQQRSRRSSRFLLQSLLKVDKHK